MGSLSLFGALSEDLSLFNKGPEAPVVSAKCVPLVVFQAVLSAGPPVSPVARAVIYEAASHSEQICIFSTLS